MYICVCSVIITDLPVIMLCGWIQKNIKSSIVHVCVVQLVSCDCHVITFMY